MIYSYTQISQYLTCPRRYRYRYRDGWRERDTRAAMLFGRAFEDAIGHLDGARCLLEWKTTSSRYAEVPAGLLALDPQLVCYSWITGIAQVAQIVFVRKRFPEVQYLRTTITDEQRQEFGVLAEDA